MYHHISQKTFFYIVETPKIAEIMAKAAVV